MKIGIDLGGSHIGIGLVNEEGKIIEKKEIDLNLKDTTKLTLFIEQYILQEIKRMLLKNEVELIGVAIPGNPKEGKVTRLINLGIDNWDLKAIIEKEFTGEIQIRNDGKCAGIAEKYYGSLKPYQDAVFLCLGTGIGGACFIQGKELIVNKNSGFEVGHMVIQKNGIQCNCGKKGCFETYCSIKRLKMQLIQVLSLNENITGKELLEIVTRRKEEQVIQTILQEYIENLIVSLSNIIDMLNPQAICFGGSFVYFKDILYKLLLEEYQKPQYAFYKKNLPQLKLAMLGNDAGIIGATIKS
ncbi:MAG: ROK family protein [Clostridia bacterium]|jgi:glucokinase|nr:ROK family protein [Clostridia bacterium]